MKTVKRVGLYILGQVIIAFGIALALKSGLGVSPITSLSLAISRVSGVIIGNVIIGVYTACMLVQILLMRRQYKPVSLLGLPFSIIAGKSVDLAKWLVQSDLPSGNYVVSVLWMLGGIVLLGLGLSVYLGSNIIPMPVEGMGLAVTQKLQKKWPKLTYAGVKVGQDCLFVTLAAVIMLLGLGHIEGIREGTVVIALLVGRAMGLWNKLLKAPIQKFCA